MSEQEQHRKDLEERQQADAARLQEVHRRRQLEVSTVQYSTVQYSTVQYSTSLTHRIPHTPLIPPHIPASALNDD